MAQDRGLLPGGGETVEGTCERSMTFVMDEEDTSLGKTLLSLWLSYGLAKTEDRAFFIDDSRWAYGRYASYFMPPPSPGCTLPPASQIVPCPHGAKHIVMSSATAHWAFGTAFKAQHTSSRRHGLERSHKVLEMLRRGYEDLFKLFGEDADFVHQRIAELKAGSQASGQPIVGMHIRRGDLHPLSYEYSRDYLPLELYTNAAAHLIASLTTSSRVSTLLTKEAHQQTLLLASDDPSLIINPDLLTSSPSSLTILPAQSRILLATKSALDASSPADSIRAPNSAYTKHIPENAGWDGGFYPSLFSSLGSSADRDQTMRMRELFGRGYLLDLAVLGGSDGVVCAVSSATCRILGVMMGWDGLKKDRWSNIDDGRVWSWDGAGW
ncbi:hypothetical protein B0A48_07096 [Cryoendolithus antarcticus]|uniref:L-Fucosyltransferase n=1 Tax=Cryoendolithus antarcticus TaxID=1507870 RepID=A0A1V8T7U1_9PEZI|nr:hypothetical protein B0A48_07096 [Cryoendolithus antarcticus]